MKKTYIAITFGPITRIISYAQDTKGLWAASYLFSYMAKKIITEFKERTFLLPQLDDRMYKPECTKGAGLFPDRYIFEAREEDFQHFCKHADDTLKEIGAEIAEVIKQDADKVTTYIKRTIKIYAVEKQFEENEDVVKLCEEALDVLECEDIYMPHETINYLALFFEKINNSFLVNDAFGEDKKGRLFDTILEYSAKEFITNHKTTVWDESKAKELNPYLKYIAIVKADGDNLTSTIKSMKQQNMSIAELDKGLIDYNLAVTTLIQEYGGQAVYLGGDDLLFFAPIKNGNNHIFSLLDKINDTFNDKLKALPSPPTLSFGVSISYYKHPMFEAIDRAEELLGKAKKSGKNCIAWSLRKHSGQIIQSVQSKNGDLYKCFKNLLSKVTEKDEGERFYTSFTFFLNQHKEMLLYVLKRNGSVKNYFDNSFNEPVHENQKDYVAELMNYLKIYVKEYNNAYENAIDSLYAILRLVGFFKSKKQ